MKELTKTPEWLALQQHALVIKKKSLAALFASDTQRFKNFSLHTSGLSLDYSKNPITQETLTLLFQLANKLDLKKQIHALFSGQCVNSTQQLPALHTALRDPRNTRLIINGSNILKDIHAALDKMENFITQLQTSYRQAANKPPITDIIHLGIGGSDLGPRMAVTALNALQQNTFRFHFISHVDSKILEPLLKSLNPENCLFIIASKSFTTRETLINAKTVLNWLKEKAVADDTITQHLVAITARPEKAIAFGINKNNIFPIWDWVGGRFSLSSCIGLTLALAIGMENFREFLRGAHTMDQHFLNAAWPENMPVLLGLLGIWQRNFFHTAAHVILPYEAALSYFPAYLQQLEMESNGKSIRIDNKKVTYATCPLIFGEIGLNGQHAFYQLFHQGTANFSADFILSLRNPYPDCKHHHQHIIASALSQSKALMEGYHDAAAPYKNLPGNHASNTLLLHELTPFTLGRLIALYEHKVFVQSVIWQINPFDQWGVEYGKLLSQAIYQNLEKKVSKTSDKPFDCSTQGLIDLYQTINYERASSQ